MACGCKQKNNPTTTSGTNINTTVSLQNVVPAQQTTLSEEQKKQIAEIAEKINKISQ